MKRLATLTVLTVFLSLWQVIPSASANGGWTTWWASAGYVDSIMRSDFPTARPISIKVFYQNGDILETFVSTTEHYEGEYNDWELMIDGSDFEYFESSSGYYFNRIDVYLPPSAPLSITVPSECSAGNYTVSWTASETSGVTYRLEEATNNTFSSDLRTVVADTTALSTDITGQTNGTYYYRVRSEKNEHYSNWVTAATSCNVNSWSTWWQTGEYTDFVWRTDFPTVRPISIKVFYRNGDTWETYIENTEHTEGIYNDWELMIDGSEIEYFESSYDYYFNRIDVSYSSP